MIAGLGKVASQFPGMGTGFQSGVPQEYIGWEHPAYQQSVANRDNVAPRRSHTTNEAPLELGRVPDYDVQFARLNADRGALPGEDAADPAGEWHPLWKDPLVQLENQHFKYVYQTQGFHSRADELQHGATYYTYGNNAAPYNMNLRQPTPQQKYVPKQCHGLAM